MSKPKIPDDGSDGSGLMAISGGSKAVASPDAVDTTIQANYESGRRSGIKIHQNPSNFHQKVKDVPSMIAPVKSPAWKRESGGSMGWHLPKRGVGKLRKGGRNSGEERGVDKQRAHVTLDNDPVPDITLPSLISIS